MRDAYVQALAHLLPPGAAWPRDMASVWMRLLRGVAASFDELHDFTDQTATQWLPHATNTRLAEWEAAAGLPDPCFGPGQTEAERRAALLARLRGYAGTYADSSPAAPGALAAYCAAIGVPATITVRTPFRVGRNRVGDRVAANDGKLFVIVAGPPSVAPEPFRVSMRVGRRLVARAPEYEQLTCALERVVPARFQINILLV